MDIMISFNDFGGLFKALEQSFNQLAELWKDEAKELEYIWEEPEEKCCLKKDNSCCDKKREIDFTENCEFKDIKEEEPEKVFGAGFEIDEPRACDYDCEEDFLFAHKLFDDFVRAGEACVKAGLERDYDVPIEKCDAIKRDGPDDIPPTDVELIGESYWW